MRFSCPVRRTDYRHPSPILLIALICGSLAGVTANSQTNDAARETSKNKSRILAPLRVDPVLLGLPPITPPPKPVAQIATPVTAASASADSAPPPPNAPAATVNPIATPVVETASIAQPGTQLSAQSIAAQIAQSVADDGNMSDEEETPIVECVTLSANGCSAAPAAPANSRTTRTTQALQAQPRPVFSLRIDPILHEHTPDTNSTDGRAPMTLTDSPALSLRTSSSLYRLPVSTDTK